jgi:hypothetical protein
MTSFSYEADLMDVCCISIITIGLAGEPQKAGWWYRGNRNVACHVGHVYWKKIPSDIKLVRNFKDDSGWSNTHCAKVGEVYMAA